jgi:hypothetical protein
MAGRGGGDVSSFKFHDERALCVMDAVMDRPAAIAQIREACKNIALQFMKIHPAVPGLADEETQKECLRCAHEMTVLLETIKKKIGRLERDDGSSLL